MPVHRPTERTDQPFKTRLCFLFQCAEYKYRSLPSGVGAGYTIVGCHLEYILVPSLIIERVSRCHRDPCAARFAVQQSNFKRKLRLALVHCITTKLICNANTIRNMTSKTCAMPCIYLASIKHVKWVTR